jgi:XTP/dITP diphosphohydrolase
VVDYIINKLSGDLMSELLLASNNQGKLVEIRSLLGELGFDLVTPAMIGLNFEVSEDGQSYTENATLKGVAYGRASGLLTLADDSGLEVDALNGAPGIYSARFSSKPGATDADRRAYLLEQLRGRPRPWSACFCCVIALVFPGGKIQYTEGTCAGEIIPDERGQNGFGYDPIFYMPELGKTMAQLDLMMKNKLSHRARALQAARPILQEYIKSEIS